MILFYSPLKASTMAFSSFKLEIRSSCMIKPQNSPTSFITNFDTGLSSIFLIHSDSVTKSYIFWSNQSVAESKKEFSFCRFIFLKVLIWTLLNFIWQIERTALPIYVLMVWRSLAIKNLFIFFTFISNNFSWYSSKRKLNKSTIPSMISMRSETPGMIEKMEVTALIHFGKYFWKSEGWGSFPSMMPVDTMR